MRKSVPSSFADPTPLILQEDKECLLTDYNLSRRIIPLLDEITDQSFEQVYVLYNQLIEESNTKPIHVVIGTPGGDVRSMLAIMNLFLLSPTPVYTYLFGETFSAGAWIFLCGERRYAPKTNLNTIMFHPMEYVKEDSFGNQKTHTEYITKLNQNLIQFTHKKTGISLNLLQDLTTNHTYYFVGNEIFEYGIANYELTSSAFWHTPKKVKTKEEKPKQLLTE